MQKETKHYIEHEVRIRMLEKIASKLDKRFETIDRKFETLESNTKQSMQHIENKIDNQFKWIIGFIGGAIITALLSIAFH